MSSDGVLVAASSAQYLHIQNPATNERLCTFQHDLPVYSSASSPNGKLVVSGSPDGTVVIWGFDGVEPPRKLQDPMELPRLPFH